LYDGLFLVFVKIMRVRLEEPKKLLVLDWSENLPKGRLDVFDLNVID